MIACSRFAMARSGSFIVAIFASTAPSPSPAPFISWTYSFIAARSSAVNPLTFFFCLAFIAGFLFAQDQRVRVLGVQPLKAAELHRVGTDGAADGRSAEPAIQHVEANVPSD